MITFYTTGCPRCTVLQKKLDAKGIAYEKFTDTDRMLKAGIREVPALRVDGKFLSYTDAVAWVNRQEV